MQTVSIAVFIQITFHLLEITKDTVFVKLTTTSFNFLTNFPVENHNNLTGNITTSFGSQNKGYNNVIVI